MKNIQLNKFVKLERTINLFTLRFIKNKKRNLKSRSDYINFLAKENNEFFVTFCVVEFKISYREILIIKELYKRRYQFLSKTNKQSLQRFFQDFLRVCIVQK